jgi:hypothetical protein
MMDAADFAKLRDDITQHGLREPIWLHQDGRIIDGRNRYRACLEANAKPTFRTWDGVGSLVAFIASLNLHRRHLTAGQRADIGAKIADELTQEAAARRSATLKQNTDPARLPERSGDRGEAREQAAKIAGVSPRYVSDAKRLRSERPDLADQVAAGAMTLPEAKREAWALTSKPAPAQGRSHKGKGGNSGKGRRGDAQPTPPPAPPRRPAQATRDTWMIWLDRLVDRVQDDDVVRVAGCSEEAADLVRDLQELAAGLHHAVHNDDMIISALKRSGAIDRVRESALSAMPPHQRKRMAKLATDHDELRKQIIEHARRRPDLMIAARLGEPKVTEPKS